MRAHGSKISAKEKVLNGMLMDVYTWVNITLENLMVKGSISGLMEMSMRESGCMDARMALGFGVHWLETRTLVSGLMAKFLDMGSNYMHKQGIGMKGNGMEG